MFVDRLAARRPRRVVPVRAPRDARCSKQAIPNTVQLAVRGGARSSCSASRWASTRRCASTRSGTPPLTTTALIIWGIPVFVLGLFMQWFFGLKLGLLPVVRVGRHDGPLDHPGRLDQPLDAHPAGRDARRDRGRLHLVHAARLDARGHPLGLRAHGAGQGPVGAHGRPQARPQERPHPGHDRRRHRPRRPDGRRHPHRDGLLAARRRPA